MSLMKIIVITAVTIILGISGYIFFGLHPESKAPTITQIDKTETTPRISETATTFLAVGDIMLSRDVAKQMSKNGNDPQLPFSNMKDILLSTDFNFGNLESPFSGTDAQDPNTMTFTFNAPTWAINGLSKYNFKMLNLANNHALNQGKAGLQFTRQYLKDNNLESIGSGENPDEAWEGRIVDMNGIKIGFIGATYAPNSSYLAQISDTTRLQQSITNMHSKSDYIVVTMHAGTEYERQPNKWQITFARAAIDAGADMVIGAHPHWIQPIEKYKEKYIFYSLGNFIFDQMWSQDTKEGLTAKITLQKKFNSQETILQSIELMPIIIENYSTPRLADKTEAKLILEKINITDPYIQ